MDYFQVLNLSREPFSNSPDPDFFFQSEQHLECMQKIELSIRLRKGLAVIIGDVGTGKTTMCRQLIRRFSEDEGIETHLILDPGFSTKTEFLTVMARTFWKSSPKQGTSDWQLKELIKKYLFRQGIDNKKTVVLIIDEGQKLPGYCLESLREFLNYETNEYKLLQIVIFAQNEFEDILKENRNFADRVNLYHHIGPLNFRETKALIKFRIERASDGNKAPDFFTHPALWAIYRAAQGYPRKIINLCHKIFLTLIIRNRRKAGWLLVRYCAGQSSPDGSARQWHPAIRNTLATAIVLLILLALGLNWERGRMYFNGESSVIAKTPVAVNRQIAASPGIKPVGKPIEQTAIAPVNWGDSSQELSVQTGSEVSPASEAENLASVDPMPEKRIEPIGSDTILKPSAEVSTDAPDVSLPEFIGKIRTNRNDTLGLMIQKVYGLYNNYYLKKVTEANSQVANPNHLEPGQEISFPAIPVEMDDPSTRHWWVEVDRKETLGEAYDYLRDYPADRPPVRIIPCWNPADGMMFVLINKQVFNDEVSAMEYLENGDGAGASSAKLLNVWGRETVLFSNPLL